MFIIVDLYSINNSIVIKRNIIESYLEEKYSNYQFRVRVIKIISQKKNFSYNAILVRANYSDELKDFLDFIKIIYPEVKLFVHYFDEIFITSPN